MLEEQKDVAAVGQLLPALGPISATVFDRILLLRSRA